MLYVEGPSVKQFRSETMMSFPGQRTGFYLLEAADLDEAIRLAAEIPAAWNGAVEVRPVIELGG